jgi:transcription antitermination factor NusA-like protein
MCNKKLADGEITKLDVEIATILYKINERHNLSLAEFSKAYELEGVVIIESSNPSVLIGKKGKIISLISSALQKRVRIIRSNSDIKTKIVDIVAPIKVIGLNSYWTKGIERVRLILEKKPEQNIYIGEETLKTILKKWLKKEVDIIYE